MPSTSFGRTIFLLFDAALVLIRSLRMQVPVRSIAVAPNGRLLAAVNNEGNCYVGLHCVLFGVVVCDINANQWDLTTRDCLISC